MPTHKPALPTALLTRRKLLALAAGAPLMGGVSTAALGHAASEHDFALTEFDKPVPAPDFTLPDLTNELVSLTDFRGTWVLLNFWATWCPPCLAEMPSMQRLHDRLKEHGFAVVALASDQQGARAVAPFVAELKISFSILLDGRSDVSAAYGARELPSSFLLNRQGQVVAAAKGAREWDSPAATTYLRERVQQA